MPIPELNEDGVLPEGIYDCTLDEIGERFGRFQTTERRVNLFKKLCNLMSEERAAGIAVEILVNGSFVTDKATPGDIDLVIVLPEGYNFGVELPPFKYNAVSKPGLHRRFGFDVFVVEANSPSHANRRDYFQKVKFPPPERKGILRVKL